MSDWQHLLFTFWAKTAQMLSAQVPLLPALQALVAEEETSPLTPVITGMIQSLRQGSSLHDFLSGYPDLFPASVVAMVKVGEQQGELDKVAGNIAESIKNGVFRISQQIKIETPGEEVGSGDIHSWTTNLLEEAAKARASDIHLQPFKNSNRVRLRIDGVLRNRDPVPGGLYPSLVGHLKMLAGMDVAEKILPQSGKFECSVAGTDFKFHVSTLPGVYGESITLRLLNSGVFIPDLPQLVQDEQHLHTLKRLLTKNWGMIIVTGPSGCGKTSTVYSMLQFVNRPEVKIITVEDPVEYTINGIVQVQLRNSVRAMNFPDMLRSAMRCDPDVIFVAEIRSLETAQLCCQCALTGHLVFSILHTDSALAAMTRAVQMGLPPFLVYDSVKGVVAQRLIRQLCPECKVVDTDYYPELQGMLTSGATFYKATGCPACIGTGFKGRLPLFEIFIPDESLRKQFLDGDEKKLRKLAEESGMKTLLQDGIDKAARGITSLEELVRILGV